jgi:cysteinyl-tRNA synthetase
VRQLLERHRGETIRLAMLGTHYRKGLDWTDQALQLADKALDKWYEAVKVVDVDAGSGSDIDPDVDAALNDDLNTPQAIAALHALASKAWAGNAQAAVNLRVSAQLLGLLGQESESWFHNQVGVTLDETKIDALVEARNSARAAKDFAEADRIRGELEAAGIALEDSAGQTYWKRSG